LSERQADDGKDKGWISYPGSMIQQNFGEEETKGYLMWDIRGKNDWDITFKPLQNYQPFLTFNWLGDFQKTINGLVGDRGTFFPGTRFRVASNQNISDVEKRQLNEYLTNQYQAEELVFKIEVSNNLENIQTDTIKIQKTSLRNNPDILVQLYNEYILNNQDSHPLSEDQIKSASDFINKYLVKLNASEPDVIARDVSWSLKSMDFDNIYRYGEGNSIDFTKLNGIVGIFGPNRIGKSSIIGTMMYSLFNATDRGPVKTAHIINENKNSCRVRSHVNISGNDYVLERTSTKDEPKRKRKKEVDNEKTSTALTITQVNPDGTTIPRTGISRDETDKELRRLIGSSEDFLLTSFASTGDMDRFIKEGATERKAVLSRFLDLDIFKKLCDYAKEDCTNLNAKTKRYSDTQWEQLIEDTKKEILQLEASKLVLESRVAEKRALADELKLWIAQKEKEVDMATILQLETDLEMKEKQVDNANRTFNELSAAIKVKQSELLQIDLSLQDINVDELETRQETLSDVKEKLARLESSFKVETSTLEHQEKSVKKLDLVPCGDAFPQCHFIRDSHENKQKLGAQRELVTGLKTDYETLKKTLETLLVEKISDKIKEHRTLSDKKLKIETNLRELKTRQKSIDIVRLVSEREQIRENLEKIRMSLDEAEEQEIEKKKIDLKVIKHDLEDCESQKNEIFLKLGSHKQRLDQSLLEKDECFDILQQLQIFESVYKAFSKNGIPAMILKNQLPAINAELDKILSTSFDFKITLETDVTANVMDVFINYPKKRRIIETASGMEKMIASLALRVALTNLSSLPRSDIFILDEGFGPLDDNSMYQCLQLMSLLKSYFRVVLVVTHMAPIKEIADRIIDIKDEGEYSYVQV
jgi:DNA repair exonuclease SbcCD ATPase subunit